MIKAVRSLLKLMNSLESKDRDEVLTLSCQVYRQFPDPTLKKEIKDGIHTDIAKNISEEVQNKSEQELKEEREAREAIYSLVREEFGSKPKK